MLKSIFGGIGKVFLPKVSFKAILGTRELKETAQLSHDLAKEAFTVDETVRQENFNQAARRLKLTSTDIVERQKRCMLIAGLFLLAAFLCFAYTIYLAFQGAIMGFFLGLSVSFLGLTYAFRYHFWAFQLKHHKLGCTLKEWWNSEIDVTKRTSAARVDNKSVATREQQQQKKSK